MTWHCATCSTTLTYTVSPFLVEPVGMMKCPRCDKWMERVGTAPDLDGG